MPSYQGIAYRQAVDPKSPWIVSFVAPAEELLSWVGIPRRSERGLVGFQRLDEEGRVTRAKDFFTQPQNQSPTALILGIHRPPQENNRVVTLEMIKEIGRDIWECRLNINFDGSKISNSEIKDLIERQIRSRLDEAEEKNIEADDVDDQDSTDVDGSIEDGDDDATDSQDGDIELGRSLLMDLLGKLQTDEWISLNREALLDLAKPATLIDGQHRIKGADKCEREIPFAVCALYDCSWAEQVFQFTVVNYTQKGIPDQFITANAALSLTATELGQLEDRLVQAQVKVIEYELMRVVNFDPTSPFFDLINLTPSPVADKIGYKTMVRVAKTWYGGRNDAVKMIIDKIYPEIRGRKSQVAKARLDKWKEGDWGIFFIAFWSAVKKKYGNASSHVDGKRLWDVGYSNLMIAVVLLELQEHFLQNLGAQDEVYFQTKTENPIEELKTRVADRTEKFVEWFSEDLFARKWKTTSLNTGAGRASLQDCFQNLIKKKGNFKYASSMLVTGKTDGAN